jgi:hypothetical protein
MDSNVVNNMYTGETFMRIILVKFTVLLVWPQEEVMLHALFDITNLWNRILLDNLAVTLEVHRLQETAAVEGSFNPHAEVWSLGIAVGFQHATVRIY